MKLILTIILALLLSLAFVAAGPFRVDENIEMGSNDIYNASNVNASKLWQSGFAVLDTSSSVNESKINQSNLNVNSSTWWNDVTGWI